MTQIFTPNQTKILTSLQKFEGYRVDTDEHEEDGMMQAGEELVAMGYCGVYESEREDCVTFFLIEAARKMLSLQSEYEAMKAKLAKAQEIHWMISDVYGRDNEMFKMAWKGYSDLQYQVHLKGEELALLSAQTPKTES